MTVYSAQAFQTRDGKYIVLPPYVDNQDSYGNLGLPDLSQDPSTLQSYPLGTKYVDGDRVYRYGKAGGTLIISQAAGYNRKQCVAYCAVQAATSALATSLTVTVGATDGHSSDGAVTADELAGGYVLIFDASETNNYPMVFLITSNSAVSAGGGTMTVNIDGKIPVALTTSDHAELMSSIFSYLCNGTYSENYQDSKVGIPVRPATVGQFLWFQTWGPCWLPPQTDVGVNQGGSAAANNHKVVFRHDGTVDTMTYNDVISSGQAQTAGWVMARGADGAQGAPFIWLTIMP